MKNLHKLNTQLSKSEYDLAYLHYYYNSGRERILHFDSLNGYHMIGWDNRYYRAKDESPPFKERIIKDWKQVGEPIKGYKIKMCDGLHGDFYEITDDENFT